MGTMEKITSGGVPMDVYVATPEGKGPFPAVLLMFHRAGIDEFTRDRADRLAKAGYIAAAPDLFHRMPPDTENPLGAARRRPHHRGHRRDGRPHQGQARLQRQARHPRSLHGRAHRVSRRGGQSGILRPP